MCPACRPHNYLLYDCLLRKKYGITFQDYNEILRVQNGVCKVCGRKPGKRRLHVDHNHKTGKVRGLLCGKCNLGIGYADEDINILKGMIEYLQGASA